MSQLTKSEEITVDPAFLDLLRQHRFGECLNELGQAMRNIVDAAQLTGKPGGITLKIIFDPTKSGAVEIMDDIAVKMPKAEKVGSLFFVGENGQLVRNNPNQLEMPLRTIEGGVTVDADSLRKVNH